MAKSEVVVGIDVGTNSLGTVAIELGADGYPLRILNAVVHVHDSGVDPEKRKTAQTRLAVSGIARRTRRLYARRRKRLQQLDETLQSYGYPIINLEETSDPHLPWKLRADLVEHYFDNEAERKAAISIALRHIARHRGWRSPWTRTEALLEAEADSPQLIALRERVSEFEPGIENADVTPAQAIVALDMYRQKIRGPKGYLGGKLMQSDHANEIRKIGAMQRIDPAELRELILVVFAAESPRGASKALVGTDPLPGQEGRPRAPKAHPAFQYYRIAAILANLRIKVAGVDTPRPLSAEERQSVMAYLLALPHTAIPIWADVAAELGIARSDLIGTAKQTADGDRAAARPPVDQTDRTMRSKAPKEVKAWWKNADDDERADLVMQLIDGELSELASVRDFYHSLGEDVQVKLDELLQSGGRAAYSVDSLERLTDRMMRDGLDVHEARKAEFGVDDTWAPPVPPIRERVGNPAVDRVLKKVDRWLQAVERRWGTPKRINIEHVREGFASEAVARELDRLYNKRWEVNQAYVQAIHDRFKLSGRVTRGDILRYSAVERQNGQCGYCGEPVTFLTTELDHIVPRRGKGSTNRRDNLMAVCERCNRAKNNIPFATWAAKCNIPGVSLQEAIERVNFWNFPAKQMTAAQQRAFKREVIARLKQTSFDPPLDGRSMESVAWMANELHRRIEAHFDGETKVGVYRGAITAAARYASGLEKRIEFIGERGKTRLDRRHHAFDAACVALMRHSVAQVLSLRSNIRESNQLRGTKDDWRDIFTQEQYRHLQYPYERWLTQMERVGELFNQALAQDAIPIRQDVRLRPGVGLAHKEVAALRTKPLSSAFTTVEIDRAATPALWCALTRLSDFDPKEGLAEDPTRTIRVNGTYVGPNDNVELFASGEASIRVRGGAVGVGIAIHHARVYRIRTPKKKDRYAMVRVFDHDLLRYRDRDVFSVALPPQSISMRYAEPAIRKAMSDGTAEYLGWLVEGDELQLDASSIKSGQIAEVMKQYPAISAWRLNGFYSASRLRLRPVMIAAEGLPQDSNDTLVKVIDYPGWLPSVDVVFGKCRASVIRRNALGERRNNGRGALPESWDPQDG